MLNRIINQCYNYSYSSYTKNNGNNHTSSTGGSFGALSRQKKNSKSSGNSISKTQDLQQYSKNSQHSDTTFFGPINGVSFRLILLTLFDSQLTQSNILLYSLNFKSNIISEI